MAMLYPPSIEGKIPAQAEGKLRIPFRLNRSVGFKEIGAVVARIKTVSSSTWIGTIETKNFALEGNEYIAEFTDLSKLGLIKGVYYKIQLAFKDLTDTLGYYSTVGVFKYTCKPEVSILGLSSDDASIASNIYTYTGRYSQENGDSSEKIYSYEFIVRDASGAITETSGTVVHDNTTDSVGYESVDEYTLEKELSEKTDYTIEYKITTINGLEASSGEYWIANVYDIPLPDALGSATLLAENDYNNGTIKLSMSFKNDIQYQPDNTYKYLLVRSSLKDNYSIWKEVMNFSVQKNSVFPGYLGEDYTVEQGNYYKYALQMEQTSGLRSVRLESKIVYADFEDMFLYDGSRQLKIRFNPKVTSFKSTILETKMDTLGGQYPFFFRNGNVNYKEFPLSGLVSFLSDEDGKFMSDYELGFYNKTPYRTSTSHDWNDDNKFAGSNELIAVARRSTQLDAQNFAAERAFKLQVLDWLNDGKAKLFRSPSEGNYIVRIMNTSLSPNDTLGRMIHTFSGTAYEVAECNYRNLVEYGFVENKEFDEKLFVVSQIYFAQESNPYQLYNFNDDGGAYLLEFHNIKNNTEIIIKYADASAEQSILIGSVGTYIAQIFDTPVRYVRINQSQYGFSDESYMTYGTYIDGEAVDFSPIHAIKYKNTYYQATGLIDIIEDNNVAIYGDVYKYIVGKIYHLRINTRTIVPIWLSNGTYYLNEYYTTPLTEYNIDCIYYDEANNTYIDGATKEKMNGAPEYTYQIKYKSDDTYRSLDLEHIGEITLHDLTDVESVVISDGLIADMFYQRIEIVYGIELTDPVLIELQKTTDTASNEYILVLSSKLQEG